MKHFRIAFRHLVKRKFQSIINVLGLSLGLTIVAALSNYIYQENSYDHFHQHADNTYKLITSFTNNQGNQETHAITLGNMKDQISNVPGVAHVTQSYGPFKADIDLETDRLAKQKVLYVDADFFEVFDFSSYEFNLLKSDAVITRTTATKLFGQQNPIGKTVKIEDVNYTVKEVIDLRSETRWEVDVILPLDALDYYDDLARGGLEFETFYVFNQHVNQENTIALINEKYNELLSVRFPLFTPDNYSVPLKDVYLSDAFKNKTGNGSKANLQILSAISFLILVLALINYLNLSIANSHYRQLEIKLKRILGADRTSLMVHTFVESFLILSIASLVAIGFIEVISQLDLVSIIEIDSVRTWPYLNWVTFLGVVTISSLLVSVLAGAKMFRMGGLSEKELKKSGPDKFVVGMVLFQFCITTVLLSGILFTGEQLDFLKSQSPGFDKENVVNIKGLGDQFKDQYATIKSELLAFHGIESVAGSQAAPGNGTSGQFIRLNTQSDEEGITISHIRVLDGFSDTYKLKFKEGAPFKQVASSGKYEFILNQKAIDQLYKGAKPVIGETMYMGGRVGPLVGIVEDFHYRSFHHEISPLVLTSEVPYAMTLSVRIAPGNIDQSIAHIESVLESIDPLYQFTYSFQDENFDQLYKAELVTQEIISYATTFAISISVLGILALVTFIVNIRTKEIAIRKTLGAEQLSLLWQLSKKLLLWITIGNVLAVPIIVYFSQQFSSGFIYQLPLTNLLWVIPVSLIATVLVAGIVTFRKLWLTVNLNPVIFLKDD